MDFSPGTMDVVVQPARGQDSFSLSMMDGLKNPTMLLKNRMHTVTIHIVSQFTSHNWLLEKLNSFLLHKISVS